jgi:hypothetical protein
VTRVFFSSHVSFFSFFYSLIIFFLFFSRFFVCFFMCFSGIFIAIFYLSFDHLLSFISLSLHLPIFLSHSYFRKGLKLSYLFWFRFLYSFVFSLPNLVLFFFFSFFSCFVFFLKKHVLNKGSNGL